MMSLSKLARRSLSRDLETSALVIVFFRMSGTGNGSCLIGSTVFVFSCSVFFLPNRIRRMSSVKGTVWPFLRNRSIPQRYLRVERRRIINGLAEERALVTALGGWCVQVWLSSVCMIVVSGLVYVSCDAVRELWPAFGLARGAWRSESRQSVLHSLYRY